MNRLDAPTLEKIRDLSILRVADELGLTYRLHNTGRWAMCHCIVHQDNNPSMGLCKAKNYWRCFSCEARGSVIDLVMRHENLNFLEACSWLMDHFQIIPPQGETRQNLFNELKDKLMNTENTIYLDAALLDDIASTDNEFTRALVQCRILTPEQMKQACRLFRLGTSLDHVVFCYLDQEQHFCEGKIMTYQANAHRSHTENPFTLSSQLKNAGKLKNEWKCRRCLFGLHQLALEENRESIVAVVESEKTAVICSQLMPCLQGTPVCWMATGGLTCLSTDILCPLKGRKVMVFPDTDSTGDAYAYWQKVCLEAGEKLGQPFTVSNLLEQHATPEQKKRKIDIADFLLEL